MSHDTNDGGEIDSKKDTVSSDRLDTLLQTLTVQRRRYILYYFINELDTDTAQFEALKDYLGTQPTDLDDPQRISIALHHKSLPHLEDVGLIEYDDHSETIRYHGDSTAEQLIDDLNRFESI